MYTCVFLSNLHKNGSYRYGYYNDNFSSNSLLVCLYKVLQFGKWQRHMQNRAVSQSNLMI